MTHADIGFERLLISYVGFDLILAVQTSVCNWPRAAIESRKSGSDP